MSDTATQQSTDTAVDNTTKVDGIPVKMGRVERVQMNFQKPAEDLADRLESATTAADTTTTTDTATTDTATTDTTQKQDKIEVNDEQLMAMLKERGIDLESLDKLKEKANYNPSSESTPEQKEAAAKANEKRAVDKFVAGGGTIEQFVAIKSVAEADLTQLSINTTRNELLTAGFSEEQANQIIKERYYQIDEEELEQADDETDREYKKRLKEYGTKKLESRSQYTKDKAAGILTELYAAIESEDLQVQKEIEISAKIDEDFKKFPRKLTIELGEQGGKTVSPIEFDFPESELEVAKKTLKEAVAGRNNILLNEDGSFNIASLTSIITKANLFEKSGQFGFLSGQDRATKHFQSVFPAGSAQELGVGGSQSKPNGGQNGKVASFGKTQRVQPQRN